MLPVPVPAGARTLTAASRRGPASSTGIFLYLVSVGLVAAATIGVFFGIAFSLLRQPANVPVSEWAIPGRGSDVATVPQGGVPRGGDASPGDPGTAPATAKPAQLLLPGAAPAAPHPAGAVAGPAPKTTASAPIKPGAKTRAAPRIPDRQLAELLARGDVFLRAGDIASARLFYERAADAGDGQAALRVGATFDPTFLASIGLRNMPADPAKALFWYHRALGLGASDVETHLNRLEIK